MESTMDKVKHALHLDKDKSTTHTTGTHTTGTHTAGTHAHDNHHHVGRDAAVGAGVVGVGEHEHHKHQAAHAGTTSYGNTSSGITGTSGNTTTAGPHSSNLANKLDPRVDSDLSKTTGTHGTNEHHYGRDAAVGAGGVGLAEHEHHKHQAAHTGYGNTSGTHGTNDHHYGRDAAVGAGGVGLAEHEHHKHQAAHTGYGNTSSGITGTHAQTTTAGPHSSNLMNKLDPTVDSDRSNQYGTHGAGVGNTGAYNTTSHNTMGNTGTTGGISNSTNAGPHNSNTMNKLDPMVDSDLSGRGNNHGLSGGHGITSGTYATPGSGTAQNTAGPHNSDLANKLDPRVDSDLDGSRTVGGNRTHY